MTTATYVILSDVTPSRGTITEIGRDSDLQAGDGERKCRWAGEHAPELGDRAWHRSDRTAVSSRGEERVLERGDYVVTSDGDTGRIISADGGRARVAWDDESITPCDLSDLRLDTERMEQIARTRGTRVYMDRYHTR